MANKKGDSVIPDFTWIQNDDEVHIIFKISKPEHLLVKIETDKVYLKCFGGNKEKKLYEITLQPLFKDIDKNKSGYNTHINTSVIIVILFKIEKLFWPILMKVDSIPMLMQKEGSLIAFENTKLNGELNNLKLQLKEKTLELKRFKKELNEKDEKIKALEGSILDKDKKLQVIEETLKNVFDKNSKDQGETHTKHKEIDNKSGELDFKVKEQEQNERKSNINQTVDLEADKEGTNTSCINKKQNKVGVIKETKQSENKKDNIQTNVNTKLEGKEQGETDSKQIKDISTGNELNKESLEVADREESQTPLMKPLVTICGEIKGFVHADTSAVFKIVVNDPSVGIEDVEAKAETPSGVKIPAYTFLGIAKRIYNIKITPTEVGTHEIKVFVKKEFALSFTTEVYDTKLIKIEKRRFGTIARPVTFKVDVSKAGKGDLSIFISHEDLLITNETKKVNDTTYFVKFTPLLEGYYDIKIIYNGRMVKNSLKYTFSIKAFPPTLPISVDFPNGQNVEINDRYEFFIARGSYNTSDFKLNVNIETPSGERRICPIHRLDCFLLVGAFVATEIGVYKINVTLNDEHLLHSSHFVRVSYNNYEDFTETLVLYVDKSFSFLGNDNKITEYLEKVPVNEKRSFFIDFSGVKYDGILKLDVLITDPVNQQVPVLITGHGSHFMVDFTLNTRGDHILKVVFNGEIVKGTPLIIKAIDDYDLLD